MDDKKKKKYPIGAEHYTIYEEIGTGVSASVHRALCNPFDEVVAVKILDFERDNIDLNNISREAQTMVLVEHPNVVKSYCSFVSDHNLWVVMPYMSGGSCLHLLKAAHPDGFEEVVIATILRDVLKGLDYLHQHGHIHRDVKAGNILIDSRAGIKLGDFGVSAYLFDCGDRQRMRNTFCGTPCWMAPEVMEQVHGYDFKADIWSFGITALELAHGHAPFSKYPPMKVLLMTLQNAPPSLDYETDKKFSKSFQQMIARCLVKDPSKRPSAKKLLKHSFFKQARSKEYIARKLLEGQPALGELVQVLKRKEEDMLAQKKMPDGQKEEISQNEYKRGISGWNFNMDDMKAQASLIEDDDIFAEKCDDIQAKQFQRQLSFASHNSDAADSDDNAHASASASASPVEPAANTAKCERSDEDLGASGHTAEPQTACMPHNNTNEGENSSADKPVLDVNGKSSDVSCTIPNQLEKGQNQVQNLRVGATNLQTSDNAQPDLMKGSKSLVNGEEVDEKSKNPVVQQKGRFKVTSENFEMEQLAPAPTLQKSHSIQVIAQHPALSSPLPSPKLPSDVAQSNTCGHVLAHALYPTLQSCLDANIRQREGILSLMKQVSVGDSSEIGNMPMSSGLTEKSLLEAAHDRENELLNQITDLQWRLICAQQEIQKNKSENPHNNA